MLFCPGSSSSSPSSPAGTARRSGPRDRWLPTRSGWTTLASSSRRRMWIRSSGQRGGARWSREVIHSLAHSITHSLITHSITHPSPHLVTHSLTHYLTCLHYFFINCVSWFLFPNAYYRIENKSNFTIICSKNHDSVQHNNNNKIFLTNIGEHCSARLWYRSKLGK